MPKYINQSAFVEGYIKNPEDEYQRKEKLSLKYLKMDKDESLTVSADGVSFTVLGKDIRKVMGL